MLLPVNTKVRTARCDNKNLAFKQSTVEQSNYVNFETDVHGAKTVEIKYE